MVIARTTSTETTVNIRERRKTSKVMAKEEIELMDALNPSPTYRKRRSARQELPLGTAAIIILGMFALFFSSYYMYMKLPRGLQTVDEEKHPDQFIAERAAWHIGNLTGIGDRVAGHINNEVHAVNYLLQEIDKIRLNAHSSNLIEVDHQIANGSYWRDKPVYSHLNVYRGIQNIVVRLGRHDQADSAFYILLNSHFDTVSMSPGAGDDATMVAIMLEVLRLFSIRDNKFEHSVVFLFNGCEEFELQGSHAFLQHPWFTKVNAIINLDAGGIGGKEMLFRATKEYPWIMTAYSRGASHAFASTVGEEIFETNLINSDTDFRNWDRYGKETAVLDCAQNMNGYVYHTQYDRFELVDHDSLQFTGVNVVQVIAELQRSKEMYNPPDEVQSAGMVFFDVLGLVFVYYSHSDGIIVNAFVALSLIVVIILCMYSVKRKEGLSYSRLSIEGVNALLIQIFSIFAAALCLVVLANFYSAVGRPLSWYYSNWIIFFLYYCPFIFIMSVAPHIYIRYKESKHEPTSYFVQMQLHAHCLILVVMLIFTTGMGVRSSFVIMLNAAGYLITTTLNVGIRLYTDGLKWVWLHCIGQILPISFYFYMAIMGYVVLIPTTGRAYNGGHTFPDLTVAILTVIIGYLTMGFILPIFNLLRFRRYYFVAMAILWIFGVICMFTPFGFPFKEAKAAQRYTIWHTERIFYRFDSSIRRSDSGYYIHTYDPIGTKYVKDNIPEMQNATGIVDECRTELFCGIPFYTGVYHGNSDYALWIPASPPAFPYRPTFRLESKRELDRNVHRYNFILKGPSRMYLHLSPLESAHVVAWNLLTEKDGVPPAKIKWNERDMYFIAFTTAKREYQNKEIRFYVDIETPYLWNKQYVMDIGFGAHFINYYDTHTSDFKSFVNGFPDFTNVQNWTALYEGYQY